MDDQTQILPLQQPGPVPSRWWEGFDRFVERMERETRGLVPWPLDAAPDGDYVALHPESSEAKADWRDPRAMPVAKWLTRELGRCYWDAEHLKRDQRELVRGGRRYPQWATIVPRVLLQGVALRDTAARVVDAKTVATGMPIHLPGLREVSGYEPGRGLLTELSRQVLWVVPGRTQQLDASSTAARYVVQSPLPCAGQVLMYGSRIVAEFARGGRSTMTVLARTGRLYWLDPDVVVGLDLRARRR